MSLRLSYSLVLGLVLLLAACSSPAPQPTPTSVAPVGPTPAAGSPATSSPTAPGVVASPTAQTAQKAATAGPGTPAPGTATSAATATAASTATQVPASPTATAQRAPTSTAVPAAPTQAPLPRAGNVPRIRTAEPGVQVFLWGSPTRERDIDLAKAAGFTWIKQMFQWDYIEQHAKRAFQWEESDRIVGLANRAGLKVVARLDFSPEWAKDPSATTHNAPPARYEDFGDFVSALVDRYSPGSMFGQIHAFEIWNEPNLAREWGGKAPNAAEYTQLLKVAYTAAKRTNPNAVIVSAGLTPTGTVSPEARPDDLFLREMYQAGAKDYFDVLGVHAAGFKAPPETSPDELARRPDYGGQRFFGFRRVEDLRKIMVEHGDADKQMMVLEMGWSTDNRPGSPYAWHAVSEQEKGEYLVRAYDYAAKNWSPWMGMMSTIYISAPHWTTQDEQYYWSLTDPDGTPRASYEHVKGRLP
jgi:polysaccharide biosynthesis protein PslG